MILRRSRVGEASRALRLRGAAGFTLAELMVATVLITLTAVGLYGGLSLGLYLVRMASENNRATEIIEGRLEAVRLYSWPQITGTNGIATSFEAEIDSTTKAKGLVKIDSPGLKTSYAAHLRRIEVELTWVSQGREHRRSMTTFVSRYGMQHKL